MYPTLFAEPIVEEEPSDPTLAIILSLIGLLLVGGLLFLVKVKVDKNRREKRKSRYAVKEEDQNNNQEDP